MSDEADKPAPAVIEQIPSFVGGLSAIASANAPFIYFDGVPNFGFREGVANLTLEVLRFTPARGGGQVFVDKVSVAHLRMNMTALRSLKNALAGIELMAQPVPEGTKN
jgi:hypothetical protein